MKKIKIAQIGTNAYSHGIEIFNSIKKQSELFEIVGYVLPENERERLPSRIKCFEGYKELTLEEVLNNSEIEAVTIETDEIYLTKYAILAAKAGKHIHMEKPGGRELADFEELISIMKKTGKVFHTGYMYRYNPYVIELMKKIKDGELGDIVSVEAQMNCIQPNCLREWLSELPGGMMFYLGSHLVDLILQIKGTPQKIIPLNKASGINDISTTDFGMAVFEYDNGISFAKTSAVEFGGFARRQLVVSGTKGTVELNPIEWYLPDLRNMQTHRATRTEANWNNGGKKEISEPFDRYDNMIKSFAQYVRGEKINPYTLDYELELYKTVLKASGG
ncbi:MAG: Gfo/Idh/MocA family oxidoreductase [Acutalibacteraceae bacterium]|nr:Gfo/Idh/MocA family oxidoreductase [Acutalibacteraceae bacterium]